VILVIVGASIVILSEVISHIVESKERVVIKQNHKQNKNGGKSESIVSDNQNDLTKSLNLTDKIKKKDGVSELHVW